MPNKVWGFAVARTKDERLGVLFFLNLIELDIGHGWTVMPLNLPLLAKAIGALLLFIHDMSLKHGSGPGPFP